METLIQDIRYGIRTLLKNPGFSAVAILALALGIGANTAIFSVVNAVLLRPLQFDKPDQLVLVWEKRMALGRVRNPASPPDFADWKAQNQVFEEMATFTPGGFSLTGGDEAERLQGANVSPSLFTVLRAQPRIGRAFQDDEDKAGNNHVVILSNGLWQRRFGSDPEIVGRTMRLNEQTFTVIGVMPADFSFPNRTTELWVPLTLDPEDQNNRGGHGLNVIARLKSGVTIEQAREEMDAIAGRLEQQYPNVNTGHGVNVFPLYEEVVAGSRPALLILLGVVALVLLIACANVANLLLARASARQKEIAIRTALGARRGRIVRQLLTESVLLSLAGGVIGALLALWGLDLLLAVGADTIPRAKEIKIDAAVLGFTLLVSLITGLIFGLVPALQASKPNLNESLKEGGRNVSASFRRNPVRSLFVIAEVAICLVLLIGAGLMIKSFARLLNINPGFNPENVLAINVSLSGSKYREREQVTAFYKQVLERISSVPGAKDSAAVAALPMAGGFGSRYFRIEGRPPTPPGQGNNANVNIITPGYFQTMNIPLIAGRDLDERDAGKSPEVTIINQEMARRYWPDEDPLGKRLAVGDGPWRTVVGVVGDVKQSALEAETRPEMFWPYYQTGVPFATLVVRTTGKPEAMIAAVRSEAQTVDKDLPLYNIKTMEQVISESVSNRRLNVLLLGIFGGLALVLAAVGLYGVMSYSVSQRTREIGIRMALGANRRDVTRLVVGQGMVLALTGVAVGLGASFALTRLMSSLLYEVSVTDPITFAALSLLLIGVAGMSSYIPARRAMKVDPIVALRYE
ncbi:MAG TPA: ABC transporter permease [Blastocatellia bacterium]|nr:ABC transporter permease [Blastocatellia bacterium]